MSASYPLAMQLERLKGVARFIPLPAAKVAAKRAQQIAPVRTGYLRDNITAEKGEEGTAQVVSAAPYSGFVEFGTRKMEAQPFLRPAIAEVEKDMVQATAKALEVEIKERLKK